MYKLTGLSQYIGGDTKYFFPFHEIFKGTMLGQWKHYKEGRAECINLFDARLGERSLLLLRLELLMHLVVSAQRESSLEVSIAECIELFSGVGASQTHVIAVLRQLQQNGLVRSTSAEEISSDGRVSATRSGGYHAKFLSRRFPYVEACILDTAIQDSEAWSSLSELTVAIEAEISMGRRMEMRAERMHLFLEYLVEVEVEGTRKAPAIAHAAVMESIRGAVDQEAASAVTSAKRAELKRLG